MAAETFFDLFGEVEEHPVEFGSGDMFPLGTLYQYVSSTLLNGLVNYTTVIGAWSLSHYREMDERLDYPVEMTANGTKHTMSTKREVYDFVAKTGDIFHTDLHMFRDDLVLLAKVADVYWFYWFDCDVSDCCIGRFKTEMDQESVIRLFDDFAASSEANQHGEGLTVPLHCFRGWMEF